jgi:hypothetical protein
MATIRRKMGHCTRQSVFATLPFDAYETRSDIEDLSFQTDNREQHGKRIICARRM